MQEEFNQSDFEYSEPDFSLLDIGVNLARRRKLIAWSIATCLLIGLLSAVAAEPEYNASMRVMSELGRDTSVGGGLGATLRNFGFSTGSSGGGTLSAQAIPDIVSSRPVRLAVVQDTFRFADEASEMSLVDYLNRETGFSLSVVTSFVRSWTIGLPGKILAAARGGGSRMPAPDSGDQSGATMFISIEEDAAIRYLASAVSVSEDIDSGLITIAVTVPDPILAPQIVNSVARQLRARVQEVYTNKSRQNLRFVEERFDEARSDLAAAEADLATFRDRNLGAVSSRLQVEEQRLLRQVTFKTQLYSELQGQVTQARIELQKAEPVITTIEAPAAPLEASGPNRKATVILATLFGGILGVGLALLLSAMDSGLSDPEDAEKLAEIRSALPDPRKWFSK